MKQVTISAKNNLCTKDVRALRRLARDFGGTFGVAFNNEGQEPVMMFFFKNKENPTQLREFENRAVMYIDMAELNYGK